MPSAKISTLANYTDNTTNYFKLASAASQSIVFLFVTVSRIEGSAGSSFIVLFSRTGNGSFYTKVHRIFGEDANIYFKLLGNSLYVKYATSYTTVSTVVLHKCGNIDTENITFESINGGTDIAIG